MDYQLFFSLIKNLIHTNAFILNKESAIDFEQKYCFNPSIQPLYVGDNLIDFTNYLEEDYIYSSRDRLGTCIITLLLDDSILVVGPFLRREINDDKIESFLIDSSLPASYFTSIKQYLSNFPIISITRVYTVINALVRSFFPNKKEMSLYRMENYVEKQKPIKIVYQENIDFEAIYKRYELENQFLRYIEIGDTDQVINAFNRMNTEGMNEKKYVNAIQQDPSIGINIIRTLARKAAENGGASPIDINEITQRFVQKTTSSQDLVKIKNDIETMILELTESVKKSKQIKKGLSPTISKIADYIRLNYSQELTATVLGNYANMTYANLSRLFKKEMGITIGKYISSMRCVEAELLLRKSHYSIQEISAYVGYLDNNYFVKVFKKETGYLPSEYRKTNKE